MKSEAHVSLARNCSIIVVVAILIGVDKTLDYWNSNRRLEEAREVMAGVLAANLVPSGVATSVTTNERPWSTFWSELTETNGWSHVRIGGEKFYFTKYFENLGPTRIERPGIFSVFNEGGTTRAWKTGLQNLTTNSASSSNRLVALYREVYNGEFPTNYAPVNIYSKIHYGIFEARKNEIPGLNMKCSLRLLPPVFAAIVVGLLVQILNLLRRIGSHEPHGIEEPWLMLDGQGGIEGIVAWAWWGAVVFSPIIVFCALAMILWSDWRADQILFAWKLGIKVVLLAVFLLVGIRVTWSVGSLSIRVRKLRESAGGGSNNATRKNISTNKTVTKTSETEIHTMKTNNKLTRPTSFTSLLTLFWPLAVLLGTTMVCYRSQAQEVSVLVYRTSTTVKYTGQGTLNSASWRGYHIIGDGGHIYGIDYGSVNNTKAFWIVPNESTDNRNGFVVGKAGRTNSFIEISREYYDNSGANGAFGILSGMAPEQMLTTRTLPDTKVQFASSYTLTGTVGISLHDGGRLYYNGSWDREKIGGILRLTVTAAYDKATTIKLNNTRLQFEEVQSFIQSNLVANGYSDITTNYWLPPFFPNTP